jgi:hypothetical protein
MVLEAPAQLLHYRSVADPTPGPGQPVPAASVASGPEGQTSGRGRTGMRRSSSRPSATSYLALEAVRKGGTVVLGGIHMSEIPAMPYRLLWGERTVRSVANLTQQDAQEFLAIAGRTPIRTEVVPYALADANTALRHLRKGQLTGAAVLVPERDA